MFQTTWQLAMLKKYLEEKGAVTTKKSHNAKEMY